MTENELILMAKKIQGLQTELSDVEVKAAKNGCPRLFDSLSSLANQNGGGVIIFGLDEANGFEACGVYDASDLMTQITNQCLQMEPVLRPLYTVTKLDEKTILSAEIAETELESKPCYYKGRGRLGGSYVRVGDQDLHMTEYEIYAYEAYRKKNRDELRPCPNALMSDLDENRLNSFMAATGAKKPNLSHLGRDKALKMLGMTDGERPTLAGMMLLGEYPQAWFPQLCITAVAIPGIKIGQTGGEIYRFTDNLRIEGTLPEMLDGAMAFVRRNITFATAIDPNTGRREDIPLYPLLAVREILLNALIHRDYSKFTEDMPISLRIYSDRLELENPGGLYGHVTLDSLGRGIAESRNPFIAGAMEIISLTENRFSGIPTIISQMGERGLPAPKFEVDRGCFRVTLYNKAVNAEKAGNGIEQDIVEFCSVPRSREELGQRFSTIGTAYLMSRYVKPMVEKGLLKLALPGKPRSKKQKYYA